MKDNADQKKTKIMRHDNIHKGWIFITYFKCEQHKSIDIIVFDKFLTQVYVFYFVQVMFIPKLIKFGWIDSFWSLIFTKTVARPVFRWAFLNNSKSQPSSSRSKLNWNILSLKIDKFVKANYKGRCKNQNLNKVALIASNFSSKYKNSSSA